MRVQKCYNYFSLLNCVEAFFFTAGLLDLLMTFSKIPHVFDKVFVLFSKKFPSQIWKANLFDREKNLKNNKLPVPFSSKRETQTKAWSKYWWGWFYRHFFISRKTKCLQLSHIVPFYFCWVRFIERFWGYLSC